MLRPSRWTLSWICVRSARFAWIKSLPLPLPLLHSHHHYHHKMFFADRSNVLRDYGISCKSFNSIIVYIHIWTRFQVGCSYIYKLMTDRIDFILCSSSDTFGNLYLIRAKATAFWRFVLRWDLESAEVALYHFQLCSIFQKHIEKINFRNIANSYLTFPMLWAIQ